jgi:hypothetical protein
MSLKTSATHKTQQTGLRRANSTEPIDAMDNCK